MIISKVTTFDLSNADIKQPMSEMSLAYHRIRNDQTQSLSERFEIDRELPPRRSFGTIQEGDQNILPQL